MKIVVAIDSFKGCLTSKETNQAAAAGIRRTSPDAEIIQVPVSDGGEGFMEALYSAIGGTLVEVPLWSATTCARWKVHTGTAPSVS